MENNYLSIPIIESYKNDGSLSFGRKLQRGDTFLVRYVNYQNYPDPSTFVTKENGTISLSNGVSKPANLSATVGCGYNLFIMTDESNAIVPFSKSDTGTSYGGKADSNTVVDISNYNCTLPYVELSVEKEDPGCLVYVGSLPGVTALVDGIIFLAKFARYNYPGSWSLRINLNNLGAHNCYIPNDDRYTSTSYTTNAVSNGKSFDPYAPIIYYDNEFVVLTTSFDYSNSQNVT